MTQASVAGRAGSSAWGWLAAVVLALLLSASAARGQVPTDTVPADTLPRDTLGTDTLRVPIPPGAVAQDTLPTDSLAQDSVVRVPPFPRWPQRLPTGFAFARWEWNREELLRYNGLSLLQLLERVPGLGATRAGDFGVPAGVSALGLGGARVRVFLDGFELDPLGFSTPDLQQLGVVDLESVRVERGLGGIRVELSSLRPDEEDPRPVSIIEAATGLYDTKLLRALLMRGVGRRSVVTVAYDQATSAGFGFRQPATVTAARLVWSYALAERSALQLEYRAGGVESTAEAFRVDAGTRTVVLRGRSELRPGLLVDAALGRATRRPEEADPLDVGLAATLASVRAGYELGPGWVEGAARLRSGGDAVAAPGVELVARGALQPLGWLTAEGEARSATLQGEAGLELSGTVRAGGPWGVSGFATLATGERALGLVRDTTLRELRTVEEPGETRRDTVDVSAPRFSALTTGTGGVRVGAEWAGGGATLGLAGVALEAGRVAPFGFFGVDRGLASTAVEAARGLEAYASLPVPFTGDLIRLEGWYAYWSELGGRPYLPEDQGRASLLFHGRFFDGQLEPSLRVEAERHGAMLAPNPQGLGFTAVSPAYSLANLYLQIRILDVRAFFVFNNFTDVRTAFDLPGRPLPGGRFYYGIHWTFRN